LYAGVAPEASLKRVTVEVESTSNLALNGWHITPAVEAAGEGINGITTVLYLHGNGGNRALAHRVQLYKVGYGF
jgi:hypothetical protein